MWRHAPRADDGPVTDIITGLQMSPLELLALLGTLALVTARWLPPAARPPVTIAAGSAVVLSAIVLGVLGIRWQLLPVLAAAALALPFALAPLIRRLVRRRIGSRPARRARWWVALPGTVVCVALAASGPAAAWAFPVPVFPEPTGRFAVGTRVLQWTDPDRPETATPDPGDRRMVVVQLWYPARQSPAGTRRAQYLGRTEPEARTVAEGLARYVGLPGFLLDGAPRARGRAVPDAPVADGGERFPVVLFSPGLGGVRTQNTAWAEELASNGYVVAALDHPYDSATVVLADGRTVGTAVTSTGDDEEDNARAAETARIRAADLSFILSQLVRLDRAGGDGPLAGRLETDRAAVTGHSLGGAAALQAARQDHRFAVVVDLDGYPRDPERLPLPQPVLALTQAIGPGTDPRYLPRLTEVLKLSTSAGYRLTVPGAAHLTFTDAPLYLPPVPSLVGSLGRTESTRVVAAATLAFLGATLRHGPGDPAAGDVSRDLASYGELTVHRSADNH
ncbi:alpha/beta hydrolase family protein [Kitasatospora misakiensis]|uniref:Alpha/beta hydrolase family protein n=1 Tax=Kitasatospora misakiensis TaxID=67330 RepID=A0ABW0WYT3_9ACTN